VNGGTLLTPSEKDALDEWYVRNASFWLDLRIIIMTLQVMFRGQCRPDAEMTARPYMRATKELPALAAPQLVKHRIG
jgi:hypothetical protein